jgi:hypothetical protein
MINLNELTQEVVENAKTQGEEWFHQEVRTFAHVEAIGNLFTSVAMSNQAIAVGCMADPNFTAAIRTLMWACFEVGKLAGRQELMDETINNLEGFK